MIEEKYGELERKLVKQRGGLKSNIENFIEDVRVKLADLNKHRLMMAGRMKHDHEVCEPGAIYHEKS